MFLQISNKFGKIYFNIFSSQEILISNLSCNQGIFHSFKFSPQRIELFIPDFKCIYQRIGFCFESIHISLFHHYSILTLLDKSMNEIIKQLPQSNAYYKYHLF